jgi:hypothetical protein
MNFDKTIRSLASKLNDGEKLIAPLFVAKLAKAVKAYPEDQTIGMIHRVMEKKADFLISRAEVKDLYKKFYVYNTRFASLFTDELGEVYNPAEVKQYAGNDGKQLPAYQVEDQVLANALAKAMDNRIELKPYSVKLAQKAVSMVNDTLSAWNLKPNKIEVGTGNEKFLIVQASYFTPKGATSFYVPIELVGNKISEASVFVGNSGPIDLNRESIKDYLFKSAGKDLEIKSSIVLDLLVKSASQNKEISAAEIALTKLRASKQSDGFGNAILGLKVEASAKADVLAPKHDDYETLQEKFDKPQGRAAMSFGERNVRLAGELISRQLNSFGCRNFQLKITNSDKSNIFYGVSLDGGKVAFTVPVKFEKGKLTTPEFMIANGSLKEFSKTKIASMYDSGESDSKVASLVSSNHEIASGELLQIIREAALNGDHSKAEDALNVLANRDQKAYAMGVSTYVDNLKGKKIEKTCSMLRETKTSKHKVCGHTNLPVHKTYVDENGNCLPLYRKGMALDYEAVSFMNAKILG